MFIWNPSLTLESKLIPGVRYHFRRFSAGRRAELELLLAEYRDRVREASIALNETIEDIPESEQALNSRKTALSMLKERIGEPLTGAMLDAVQMRALDMMPTFRSEQYRRNQARLASFNAEMESLASRYHKTATLRCYLTRVEGMTLDGDKEITVAQFIADAPEELSDEALAYINEHGGMSADELKNSLAPSISSDPALEGASTTTAGSAETGATTSSDGAPATSPTT